MKIANDQIEFDDADIATLSAEQQAALNRRAQLTRITNAQCLSGLVNDFLADTLAEHRAVEEKEFIEALRAAPAEAKQAIKSMLIK